MRTFKPGDILKHFKRELASEEDKKTNKHLYKVIDIAMHTETGEDMLVYQALYYPFKTFTRPLDMALRKVSKEDYPNVSQTYCLEIYNGED